MSVPRRTASLLLAVAWACATCFHTNAFGPDEYRVCGLRAMTVLDLFKEIDVGNCKAIEFYRPMTKAEVLQLADEVREHEDGVKSIKLVGTVLHREVHAVNDGDGMNSLAPVLGELLRKGCASIELERAWISDAGVDALVDALLPALRDVPPGRIVHASHVGRPHGGITLGLQGNRISNAGATRLAELLPYLVTLDLSKNVISDEGARSFVGGLATSHVHRLDLSGNQVSKATLAELTAVKSWLDVGLATYPGGRGGGGGGDGGRRDGGNAPPATTALKGDDERNWKTDPIAAINYLVKRQKIKEKSAKVLRAMEQRNSAAFRMVYAGFRAQHGELQLDDLATRFMQLLVYQGHEL